MKMNKNTQNFIFAIICIVSLSLITKQFILKHTLPSETNLRIYGKTDLVYSGLDRYIRFYISEDLLVIHYLNREYKEYRVRSFYWKNIKIERELV
jgi:hypothetical protein